MTATRGHEYGKYEHCEVSSWRGSGDSPADNKCKLPKGHPGSHTDKHGNHYDADGVLTIRNSNRPGGTR